MRKSVRGRAGAPAAQTTEAVRAGARGAWDVQAARGARAARGAWARAAWAAAMLAAAAALFWCYLRQSQTTPVNSDGAGTALQGWDMVHGNLLLSGWRLADVTFYSFEVPVNALVEAVHGLDADVVHISAAVIYTLLVLTGALLAKGSARGAEGVTRALLGAGIMVAPAYDPGTRVVLLSPDHIGVGVPIMLTLLLVDRARRHWLVPPLMCVMLTWAQVDDPIATYVAAAPMALVCLVRAFLPALRRRRILLEGTTPAQPLATTFTQPPATTFTQTPATTPSYPPATKRGLTWGTTRPYPRATNSLFIPVRRSRRPGWYDAGLCLAAVVSVALTRLAVSQIEAAGGYSMHSLTGVAKMIPFGQWGTQIQATADNTLILFGADFYEQPDGIRMAIALLHLVGVTLALIGMEIGIARLFRRADRVTQILTVSTGATLAAGTFGAQSAPLAAAHEIALVLPFGAVLAGRTVGPWLARKRWLRISLGPLLGVALACYLAVLGYNASLPSQPAQLQALADWLTAHDLTSGLGKYWAANITTLDTGERVRVAAVQGTGRAAYTWVTKPTWYDASESYANFVVAAPGETGDQYALGEVTVRRAFGTPAYEYSEGYYLIMVWNRNILLQLPPLNSSPQTGFSAQQARRPFGSLLSG